jgi:hypothetical protein
VKIVQFAERQVQSVKVEADLQGSQNIVEIIAIEAQGRERTGHVFAPRAAAEIACQKDAEGPLGVELYGTGFFPFANVDFTVTGSGNARH